MALAHSPSGKPEIAADIPRKSDSNPRENEDPVNSGGKGSAEEDSPIGGKKVTTAARGARRSVRLARILKRVRRSDPRELSGVGALVGVTELVRAESDLPTVLSLIARTVSEVL